MLRSILSFLIGLFRRSRLEAEMTEEFESHFESRIQDLVRSGVPRLEATRRARLEFGAVDRYKEECREAYGFRLADELRGDFRYAVRMLLNSPNFTVVSVLSLALGIGANTAIFSLIDAALLRKLPVRNPHELYFMMNAGPKGEDPVAPPYPCFEQFRDHNSTLSAVAAIFPAEFKVTINGRLEEANGQFVSGNFFDLLGVRAFSGPHLHKTR